MVTKTIGPRSWVPLIGSMAIEGVRIFANGPRAATTFWLRAPEDCRNRRHDLVRQDGLGDVPLVASIQGRLAILRPSVSAEGDRGHASARFRAKGTEAAHERIAVDVGHVNVHQDKVGPVGLEEVERLEGVFGFEDAIAFGGEDPPDEDAVFEVVLHVQDGRCRGHRSAVPGSIGRLAG